MHLVSEEQAPQPQCLGAVVLDHDHAPLCLGVLHHQRSDRAGGSGADIQFSLVRIAMLVRSRLTDCWE